MSLVVCGFDIETSGLEFGKDRVLELAWVIRSLDYEKPLSVRSYLIRPDPLVEGLITPEISELTGIHEKHMQGAYPLAAVLNRMTTEIRDFRVGSLVAHNGLGFDLPFLKKALAAMSISMPQEFRLPCIDTYLDVPYPKSVRNRNLTYLAATHGFLNPFPHDALSDVLTTLRVLFNYDVREIFRRAATPMLVVSAGVSYENREMAKEKGYSWERVGNGYYQKKWVKCLREYDFDKECQEAPFPVHVVGRQEWDS